MLYISRELVHIDFSRSAFRLNGWFRTARKFIPPFLPVDYLPAIKELTNQLMLPFVIYARTTSNFLAEGFTEFSSQALIYPELALKAP